MQTTLLPKPDDLPSFGDALQQLGAVPAHLYGAFEHAGYRTSQFRDAECPAQPMDAGVAATLMRFWVMPFLQNDGLDPRVDEEEWISNQLAFLGISFYYKQLHVRVLKGCDGTLPGCGYSGRKRRFFNQVQTSFLRHGLPLRTTANLIVLWDLTPSYGLSQLWLALPAVGGPRQQDVSAYWCEPIPHPAESTSLPPLDPDRGGDDGLGDLVQPRFELPDEKVNER